MFRNVLVVAPRTEFGEMVRHRFAYPVCFGHDINWDSPVVSLGHNLTGRAVVTKTAGSGAGHSQCIQFKLNEMCPFHIEIKISMHSRAAGYMRMLLDMDSSVPGSFDGVQTAAFFTPTPVEIAAEHADGSVMFCVDVAVYYDAKPVVQRLS
jgi:hypothetical protein